MACGRSRDTELIIPRPSGGAWTREDWANWRRRVWPPRRDRVTGDLRPYCLRGSFVSLLVWEGRSLTYVAEQAGHSVATLARHYAGTMRELESKPRVLRRRGHPADPRGGLRDALRTHPANRR
jgi:hypothetical protein